MMVAKLCDMLDRRSISRLWSLPSGLTVPPVPTQRVLITSTPRKPVVAVPFGVLSETCVQPNPGGATLKVTNEPAKYASHAYQAVLKQHEMVCSMSRKGNCWDNAPVERFFSSLKREWTGDRLYLTRQAAIADVREYVEVYYNSKRLHSTLGYKTPMNYEKDLNKVSGIA